MIIQGKLVVSKKKKLVLVAELKANNFKTFEKHIDAIKEGELAPIVEENDEVEEDTKIGAGGYEYLLGMPIWSLTQERVEKLMRQIGNKEHEIDKLIKLSKEDLWRADLEEFIKEWRFQLADEADRKKQARRLGRRDSRKLKIGVSAAAAKKRKAYGDDDSDFDAKGRTKKTAVVRKEAPVIKKNLKQGGLLSHLQPLSKEEQEKAGKKKATDAKKAAGVQNTKTQPRMNVDNNPVKNAAAEDVWMTVDKEDGIKPSNKITTTNKSKLPASIATALGSDSENDDDEELPSARPAAARGRRAATTKPTKYALSDSDSGSDGNFDVGKMVRGVPTATTSEEPRPLFSNRASMSRPGSSSGLLNKKSGSDRRATGFDTEADDTDYAQLAPPTVKKTGIAVMARDTAVTDDNEDDSDDAMFDVAPAKKVVKPSVKPKAAPKATVAAKKAPAPKPSKPLPLSPAAKAYAKKQEKVRMAAFNGDDSDDHDTVGKVANEILDDGGEEEDEVVVTKKPARRAAAAAATTKARPNYTIDSDDDDDDEDEEAFDEDESDAAEEDDDEDDSF